MNKDYYYNGREFVIENFADKPPFTDFLPGIAGVDGRPLWAFFVNRGQGIAGFGTKGKEHPIMEFSPAEIAYANAPRQGFRTFLRVNGKYREPFAVLGNKKTRMRVRRGGFTVEETCAEYAFTADYFGVPHRDYAALGRVAKYTNRTDKPQTVEVLDGLATVLPFGLSNTAFKETGNLMKSWMCVEGVNEGFAYYKLRSSTADSAQVEEIAGGNFFVAACDACAVRAVVDGKIVFGADTTKTKAAVFGRNGIADASFAAQNTENEVACAFAHGIVTVAAGQTVTFAELFGYADDRARVAALKRSFSAQEGEKMQQEADELAESIAARASTHTAYPLFDQYIRQSYFDNVLRGGMPVTLGDKTYYVYSRKHGDPERDYNAFSIEPQPYSCGAGNFRDVAQNRRNDVLFTPACGDCNVRYFFSLLQLDGYNPLTVGGVKFCCYGEIPAAYRAHEHFLREPFTVGELCHRLGDTRPDALGELLRVCEEVPQAAFGEGYWTDHFAYLIDLVTSYLAVYPDKKEQLLYETPYKWFASRARVLPRSQKTVLRADGQVRRYNSVAHDGQDGWARQADGQTFTTCLAAKLLFLAAIKTATLDPLGCGMDMEADKPGWNDATNGLPSLFGSNVADAQELLRLLGVLRTLIGDRDIVWSEEQNELFVRLTELLRARPAPAEFYEQSNRAKESYREKIYAPLSGKRATVPRAAAADFLTLAETYVRAGAERAQAMANGCMPTYLVFTPNGYEPTGETQNGRPLVRVKSFSARPLPLFAEGIVKSIANGQGDAYDNLRQSDMRDKALGVYRTSEPLDGESLEIGRIRSFPKGWLERESCFLHMHYKLLLALLQAERYDAFFEEIRTGFVPFFKPQTYGRSTLQNSSFIATSNHCDKRKWGKGFQARLTGANAEVLSMWRILMGVQTPFTVADGRLRFALRPVLPPDFFDDEKKVSFLLFGKTNVTYRLLTDKPTYKARVTQYLLRGEDGVRVATNEVTGELAAAIRNGKITEIEVDIE